MRISKIYIAESTVKLMQKLLTECKLELCDHVYQDCLSDIKELEDYAQLGYMMVKGQDDIRIRSEITDMVDELSDKYDK